MGNEVANYPTCQFHLFSNNSHFRKFASQPELSRNFDFETPLPSTTWKLESLRLPCHIQPILQRSFWADATRQTRPAECRSPECPSSCFDTTNGL